MHRAIHELNIYCGHCGFEPRHDPGFTWLPFARPPSFRRVDILPPPGYFLVAFIVERFTSGSSTQYPRPSTVVGVLAGQRYEIIRHYEINSIFLFKSLQVWK